MLENLGEFGIQCQMRRLDLVSRAALYRFACNSIEFFRAKTRIQAMAESDECQIRWQQGPLWQHTSIRTLIANFDQITAIPSAPVPGTPRIQSVADKWLQKQAPVGYKVPMLYRMKKLCGSDSAPNLDRVLMALRRLETLVPCAVIVSVSKKRVPTLGAVRPAFGGLRCPVFSAAPLGPIGLPTILNLAV